MADDSDVLEELASLPTLAHPTASPDGDEVAFYYDTTGRNELHVLDVETGTHEPWTDGAVPRDTRWWVKWAADGERVFFHLDEAGDEQNDLMAIDRDGTVEPVVELTGQTILWDVGEDGRTLLLGSNRDGQMNLFAHDLPTGETTKLTGYERAAQPGLLSPGGDRIAYATNETDRFENQDLYVAAADGSEPRNLEVGATGAEAEPADWHPHDDVLLMSDNTEDLRRCGTYDLDAGEVTWYGDLQAEEQPIAFLPDGERFLALRTRACAVMPIVYDPATGEARELDLPEGVASSPFVGEPALAGDRVLVTHTTPTTRTELFAYDLRTDDKAVFVEAEYGDLDPGMFADAEYFSFESDGVPETPAEAVEHDPYEPLEIEALLYDSGRRPSPLIVNPHGGPRSADYRRFDLYTQFLVSRGYSVLQVNYRGSAGRGRAFVEALYDDWGGGEQGDVAVGAEAVLERDWIDENRVVVFGGSYGGYSALWQLVQYPGLYDAGVAWIGVSELRDMYENTMPHYRTELLEKYLGTPDEHPDLYDGRSPASHLANLDAPLLVVHGVNDPRVPISQARIVRDRLLAAGFEPGPDGDFEYEELGEEGHASSDIDRKIRMFRVLDDYLARRIGTAAEAADD